MILDSRHHGLRPGWDGHGEPAAAMEKLALIGLKCPLPVIRTRKALSRMQPGQRLEVHCTDPLSVIDIPNLIRETGDRVEISEHSRERIVFVVEKGGATA
jgi:tRNA 2-thiouridine synthesizing protein A